MTAITHQSPFEQIKRIDDYGIEYWSGRDLYGLMAYSTWQKFATPLRRAMSTAANQGHNVEELFTRSVNKSEGGRPAEDFHLTRFAAYLVAMNGDPNIPEVAAAQAYFAIQTRAAETRPTTPALPQDYASALRELAATVEREAQLTAKVEADAPKVGYVDAYVADADLLTLRTVAGSLDVKETDLRQLLIERGWIYFDSMTRWSEKKQQKETIRRYSAYADKKPYFTPIPVHEAPRFKGEVMHTLKVTPQGAEAIARLVGRTTRELMEVGA